MPHLFSRTSSKAATLGTNVVTHQPETDMPNLEKMSRVLYGHDWRTVDEWAAAIDQLADLSDPEILQLASPASAWRGRTGEAGGRAA